MNFWQYLKWRLKEWVCNTLKPCDTCQGCGGCCNLCSPYHNLYRKDWEKAHWKKVRRRYK